MVDDIRPQGLPPNEDQNKDAPAKLDAEPAQQAREDNPVQPIRPYADTTHIGNEQHGFVVLPDGKSIKKNSLKALADKFNNLSKKQKIITIIALVLVLIGAGGGVYALTRDKPAPPPPPPVVEKKEEKPKPTTEASSLTGVSVPIGSNKRPITSIQIENSPDARPQSGLRDAGVVFEAIAEGGITRFLALFQETQPQYVGPVRSLRPYYLDWLVPFDASIAHVGGSPQALTQVRAGLKDLDQFFNSGSYWRQNTRPAPHNVYTSFAKMDSLNKKKGYNSSKVQSWPRKPEQKPVTPLAKTININVSGALYKVHYDYDLTTNTYLRSEGGKPHTDTVSAADKAPQQLRPKVVVVLIMKRSIIDSRGHNGYATNGSGSSLIFQDGGVSTGTWSKSSRDSQFVFNDPAEKALTLNAGQVWVTMAQAASAVTYAP